MPKWRERLPAGWEDGCKGFLVLHQRHGSVEFYLSSVDHRLLLGDLRKPLSDAPSVSAAPVVARMADASAVSSFFSSATSF